MSGDEIVAMLACIALTVVGWGHWYWLTAQATVLGSARRARGLLYAVPLLCGVLLLAVLRSYASHDVRDSPTYLVFYLLMGAAWLRCSVWLIPLAGMSVRFDALERRNSAAQIAASGALIALTLCFAGANIGDGPGWWVVVFCAALSTGGLLLLWSVTAKISSLVDALTIDRDRATGIRLAGYLVASGAILGRAVAGDWHSGPQTIADFVRLAWPAALLAAVHVVVQRLLQPSKQNPAPGIFAAGVTPAAIYLLAAACSLVAMGWW